MSTVGLALGTLVVALGTGILCCAAAVRGRGLTDGLRTALLAVEAALVTLVVVHVSRLGGSVTAKQAAYLVAGVLLLPVVVLGAASSDRSRAAVAAVASVAAGVLALRIEAVT